MADNNPTARKTLARLAGNVLNWSFTSTFQIDGRDLAAAIAELTEEDKLEIAGRDRIRLQRITILISLLKNVRITPGDPCVLDADNKWQVKNWTDSPDGALRTFLLIDAD